MEFHFKPDSPEELSAEIQEVIEEMPRSYDPSRGPR
jgi:hypothetical protein